MRYKSTTVIISVFVFVIICGWFYWFQWRPSEIRKKCVEKAKAYYLKSATFEDEDGDGRISKSLIEWFQKRAKRNYDDCLHEEGLK